MAMAARWPVLGPTAGSPDGEGIGARAGLGQLERAEREPRLTGPPHRDHLAVGWGRGQHDQAAVRSPGQVGRLDGDVGGGQVGQVLPAAGGGVQQPQVIAFLARSGQAVEPDGDVAAVGVDGGDVGAAAQPARPPEPPTAVAGQVGQGERGLGFGAAQQQLAGGGKQASGREPEPGPVAGLVEEAGRARSGVFSGAGGDQQSGRQFSEQLGRARDRPGRLPQPPIQPDLAQRAGGRGSLAQQPDGPAVRAAATSRALPSWTAAVRSRQIPYTPAAGGRQVLQIRSETITACSPTGSTDTTRSPPSGRPATSCTRCRSRSMTNGAGAPTPTPASTQAGLTAGLRAGHCPRGPRRSCHLLRHQPPSGSPCQAPGSGSWTPEPRSCVRRAAPRRRGTTARSVGTSAPPGRSRRMGSRSQRRQTAQWFGGSTRAHATSLPA